MNIPTPSEKEIASGLLTRISAAGTQSEVVSFTSLATYMDTDIETEEEVLYSASTSSASSSASSISSKVTTSAFSASANAVVSTDKDTFTFYFYNKDHLGNIREVVDENGSVCQVTNYYPFGTPYSNETSTTNADLQPYKYNSKELDRMHGLDTYDYGARQYDPVLCRWDRIDPLCGKYYGVGPYVYCMNNPVMMVDPDGRDWYQNNKTSYYTWYSGDGARDGFTYIGGKGSVLGEFESKINNILIDVYINDNGLYSEGRTVDITNPNKGAIIPSQLSQMDNFLGEFVFGYGPEISILTSNHPYTKALQSEDRVIESQQKLRAGNTTIPGQITKVNRSWGPLDALSTTSIAKQFVGSYTFDSYTSNDKKHLLNIIYDTKNLRSLFIIFPELGT